MNSDLGHSAASASEASTTQPHISTRVTIAPRGMSFDAEGRLQQGEHGTRVPPTTPPAEQPRGTDAQILKERELTAAAIRGAMAFGYLNTNPPPNEDHWLAEFWREGRQRGLLEERAVEAEPATTSRITPDAPASPAPPQGEREAFREWARTAEVGPDESWAFAAFQAGRASLRASTQPAVSAEARLREVEGYLACRLDEQDFQACVRAVATLRGLLDATRNPDEFVRSMLDAAMGTPPADNKENGNGR